MAPANHNSAASYLAQARMLKINIVLLNDAFTAIIPLNVTQTTVTWSSSISITVAQLSGISKATIVPSNDASITVVQPNNTPTIITPSSDAPAPAIQTIDKPTDVVQSNKTPAAPLSCTFASSSNTRHCCPTQC